MIIFRINTETDLDLKQMTYYQENSCYKTGYILQYSLKTKKITFKAISGVYEDTLFTCGGKGFFKHFCRHTKYYVNYSIFVCFTDIGRASPSIGWASMIQIHEHYALGFDNPFYGIYCAIITNNLGGV
jgi:hypothetical protein